MSSTRDDTGAGRKSLRLSRAQLEQIVARARADAPNETCGLIGGKAGRALAVYPLHNVDDQPRLRYLGDPEQQLHALQELDERGWELLAIYHSHPASPAYPSATDIARAFYPEAIYLLISLMHSKQTIVRAFNIQAGRVSELTLEIEDQEDESS